MYVSQTVSAAVPMIPVPIVLSQWAPDVLWYLSMSAYRDLSWTIERWWSAQGLACTKEGSVGNLSSLASYCSISIYL